MASAAVRTYSGIHLTLFFTVKANIAEKGRGFIFRNIFCYFKIRFLAGDFIL